MAATKRQTYAERLIAELDVIESNYSKILSASGIKNIDPNRGGSGVIFVGAAQWGWEASGNELEAARMALLQQIRGWAPRFRLLFPHATPKVAGQIDKSLTRMEKWLTRERGSKSVPATIPQAQQEITNKISTLRGLFDLLPADDYLVRLVVDTNALIDNPDLAAYTAELGGNYVAHLLPVVLRELDDQKRAGRNETVREGAKRAERRLKGIRTNGDVLEGVRVQGNVVAKFEHIEPQGESLPGWLDLSVPDDRLVASALLLQSQHPGSAVYVATSDINLQTKLSAARLPYIEPPALVG